MSEENEQGEEEPKDVSLSGLDEYDFYFSFTKPLVLDLPSSEERAIAAAWVQKLEEGSESDEEKDLKLNYLKLLLFVLQRGRLSGIFKKQPPSGPLQPFPQGFTIMDMGNLMLDQDDGQACGAGDARSVPYIIEISNDLREFVASQEIPNFGIQMYYAWSSDDPIHKWASFDEEKFPQYILDKIKQLKEIKSDEKSSIVKNCLQKKKICDITLTDKSSKKKVKSPQEIERSQGRSFHTYMGLVGRMGNFNDKCDDDPEKFQRQDPRKVKCPRRPPQKRCPANGGEADNMMPEEDYNNLASGLGGHPGTQARKCNCPYPCQHENCPDHHPRGGPQAFDQQPSPGRNGCVRDVETIHCPPGGAKPPSPRRLMEEQCADQRRGSPQRNQSNRSRSGSPNRLPVECPQEGTGGLPKRTGVCVCSSPPCTCPCPRGGPPQANSDNAGGRSPAELRCPKPAKQDACGPEGFGNRLAASYNAPAKTPDSCPPMSQTFNVSAKAPDSSPTMTSSYSASGSSPYYSTTVSYESADSWSPLSETYNVSAKSPDNCPQMSSPNGVNIRSAGASKRTGQSEITHCYDARNPDPALYEKMDKEWMEMARQCGNKRLESDYQNFMSREQPSPAVQSLPNSTIRGRFKPLAQSTPVAREPLGVPSDIPRHAGRYCPPPVRASSPLVHPNQVCDYPEDAAQPYSSTPRGQMNQQYQQGYVECEGEAFSPIRSPEPYGQRPKPDTPRQPPTPTVCKPKSSPGGGGATGRYGLANMASVLQDLKQMTEAHREKSGARRPSPQDGACYAGNVQAVPQSKHHSQMAFDNGAMASNACPARGARSGQQVMLTPQSKPVGQYSPNRDRGYVNLPSQQQSVPQRRSPAAAPAAPECYPNNQSPFQEFEYDEDDCDVDIAAYDSLEACRPESPPGTIMPCPTTAPSLPRSMQQARGNSPIQGYPKASSPMMYGNEADSSKETCSPQWVSMKAVEVDPNRGMPSRGYQPEMVDVDARPMGSQRGPTQSASCRRTVPPRSGSPTSTTARVGSPRSYTQGSPSRGSPGATLQQDMSPSQRECSLPADSSRRNWGNRTPSPGDGTTDFANIDWATPVGIPVEYRSPPAADRRRQEGQAPPPCMPFSSPPAMSCPPQNMPRPPPNSPCPPSRQRRSPANYANYQPQQMNAELRFQELYDEETTDDTAAMDMNELECSDQQTYILSPEDQMCENDAGEDFTAFGDEDNENCEPQNFMSISGMDGADEGYYDEQDADAENCDPVPQNMPMNRPGGAQRNASGQGQLACQPPPACNRNQNSPGQFSGGMPNIHHH